MLETQLCNSDTRTPPGPAAHGVRAPKCSHGKTQKHSLNLPVVKQHPRRNQDDGPTGRPTLCKISNRPQPRRVIRNSLRYRDVDSPWVRSGHSRRYRAYLSYEEKDSRVEPLIVPVRIVSKMNRFEKAEYYNSYGLNNRSQRHEKQTDGLINRDKKSMSQMMRFYFLSGKEAVHVITFLCKFVPSCNCINVQEGDAMWLLPSFTARSAGSAFISCLEQPSGAPTNILIGSYCGAVKFLLTRYATKENLFTAQAEITMMESPKTDPIDF